MSSAVSPVNPVPSPWNVSPIILPKEPVEFADPVIIDLCSPSLIVPYEDPVNWIILIGLFVTLTVFPLIEKNAPSLPFTVAYWLALINAYLCFSLLVFLW